MLNEPYARIVRTIVKLPQSINWILRESFCVRDIYDRDDIFRIHFEYVTKPTLMNCA